MSISSPNIYCKRKKGDLQEYVLWSVNFDLGENQQFNCFTDSC